jgi:hypothetical protein
VRAITLLQGVHGRGGGLGQDLLGLGQWRWHPGDPRGASIGERLQIVGAGERAIGDDLRRAIGNVQLLEMVADNLAKVAGITAVATEWLHQHGKACLVFDHQIEPHLVEVRAMSAARATGHMHDLF